MSAPTRYEHTLLDGRVFWVEIPASGDIFSWGFVGGLSAYSARAIDAVTISQAIQHAAVQVGQREAPRRVIRQRKARP